LAGVPEAELPQQRPGCGGWVDIVKQDRHPSGAQHVQILDAVSASAYPAITVSSFGAGFAAPDLIRGAVIDTLSAMISGSLVWAASPSSGTSPASDTRLSSSKRAEPAVNLWETRAGSALPEPGRSVPRNTYRPSSRALLFIHAPITSDVRPRIQAKLSPALAVVRLGAMGRRRL